MNNDELKQCLLDIYETQEQDIKNKYNRSLSFQDGLFDRFQRASRLGFGEGASIYNSALVYGNVIVGNNSWVGPNVLLDGSGDKIEIGSYCSISAGVHIYTHDSVMWALSGGIKEFTKLGVTIDNNCYIGAQSIIKAGVTIGKKAIVGSNSFVNKDVAANTIVAGSPAKKIGVVIENGDEIYLEYF